MTNSFDRKVIQNTVGTTPRANIVRNQKPFEPTKTNEKEDVEISRTIKVHMASKSWTVMEDGSLNSPNGTDLNIVSKLTGIGITVRNNGDIMFTTGSQAGGKVCGGRMLINAKGGQLIKSGPSIQEYVSNEKSAVEGGGESDDKEQIALSQISYANNIEELHGEKHIKGRQITIDAGDVLTLMAKEKIVLQAGPQGGGEIVMNAGSLKTTADNISTVSSKQELITKEDTITHFDPRGSHNIVSSGHLNIKCLGDFDLKAMGVGRMDFKGLASGPLLVKDSRLSAFNIQASRGNISTNATTGNIIFTSGIGEFPTLSGLGSVITNAQKDISQTALVNYSAKATGTMDLEALGAATLKAVGLATVDGTAGVKIKSVGDVSVQGAFIRLN